MINKLVVLAGISIFTSCSIQTSPTSQKKTEDSRTIAGDFDLLKVMKTPVPAKQVTIHFSTGMFVEMLIKIQSLLVEKCYLPWSNNFFAQEEAKEAAAVAVFQKRVNKLATPTLSFTVSAYTQNDNSYSSAHSMLMVLASSKNDVVILSAKQYAAITDKNSTDADAKAQYIDPSGWETKINGEFISVWNKGAFDATDLPVVIKAQGALFAGSGFDLTTLSLGLSLIRAQLKVAETKPSICKKDPPPTVVPMSTNPISTNPMPSPMTR